MKVTRAWLERGEHCPDGMAYALAVLPPEGLELEQCWALLHRPDWVISLAVQSHFLSLKEAREILTKLCPYPANEGYAVAPILEQAYEATVLGRERQAGEMTACAQIIKSYREGPSKALKLLQGAAYSLGQAEGDMKAVAGKIKGELARRGKDVWV